MKLEKFKRRNPKNIGIAIFTIACVLLIAFVFIYSSFASFQTNETRTFINGNVVDPGDLYFAFYVDGVISSTMPAKGEGYVLDKEKTTCTNGATVEWLADEWAPKINNLTKARTKCTLYFKEQTFADILLACNDTAAKCLKNNASLNTAELVDDETVDHNIRYIGANPNNYVTFNNELWRIIGVMNNIDDGTGTKETRLKIIRNELYSEDMRWDTDNVNDWSTASLQEELNGTYLENITSPSKEMIGNAIWKLGGLSSSGSDTNNYQNAITSTWYTYERGTEVYEGRPTEWTGKIGLMYPSDYGYATSGGSITNRETCLNTALYNWKDYDDCFNHDWLHGRSNEEQWTLTSGSSRSDTVFRVNFRGGMVYNNASIQYIAVTPALYLNSNVKITSGEGTESNPFNLSL